MPRGVSLKAKLAPEARRLWAEGWKQREICELLRVPRATVGAWLSDPDLEKQKARERRYAGICEGCGNPTTGCNGPGLAPALCKDCARPLSGERSRERARPQRELIERMWREGRSSKEIGSAVGWGGKWPAANRIGVLRRKGYDLPPRRPDLSARMKGRPFGSGELRGASKA